MEKSAWASRCRSSRGCSPGCPGCSAPSVTRRTELLPETKISAHDSRTIILAPTGKDNQLIAGLLQRRGMPCHAVSSADELCREIELGAGAALISEEAMTIRAMTELHKVIEQ